MFVKEGVPKMRTMMVVVCARIPNLVGRGIAEIVNWREQSFVGMYSTEGEILG